MNCGFIINWIKHCFEENKRFCQNCVWLKLCVVLLKCLEYLINYGLLFIAISQFVFYKEIEFQLERRWETSNLASIVSMCQKEFENLKEIEVGENLSVFACKLKMVHINTRSTTKYKTITAISIRSNMTLNEEKHWTCNCELAFFVVCIGHTWKETYAQHANFGKLNQVTFMEHRALS